MKNWFSDGSRGNQLDEVRFANGTVRTAAQINTRALEVNGTTAADTISGVNAFYASALDTVIATNWQ